MSAITGLFQHMPAHVLDYAIYGCIAVVAFIGIIKCLIPLWGTTHSLRVAIRKLQDEAGTSPERPVWQESRFLGRRLKGCWLRFLQNAEQLDRRGLPCNVEDYVNDDTVTHGPGNATLAELIPSLLTSLGILGTFVGMTQGLSGLNVTTTESMMNGIQNLLNGMQFAFGTSVAGVACSLAFNMLNRILQGSSYRAIDDFVESFTSLAMQRPLDNDVQLICQNQDRNHMLNNVSDSMLVKVPAAMENAVRNAMVPVTRSMDHFLVGATTAQIDGIQRIVGQFITEMNHSLDGQFLALGRTMNELNQSQRVSVQRLQESLEATGGMLGEVTSMQKMTDQVLGQFRQYIQELEHARKRDETFEQRTAEIMQRIAGLSDEQSRLLNTISAAQEKLSRSIQSFSKDQEAALGHISTMEKQSSSQIQEAGSAFSASSRELSRSYQQFVDTVVSGLSTSLGMFEKTMNEVTQSFSEQIGRFEHAETNAFPLEQIGTMQNMLHHIETILADMAVKSAKEE